MAIYGHGVCDRPSFPSSPCFSSFLLRQQLPLCWSLKRPASQVLPGSQVDCCWLLSWRLDFLIFSYGSIPISTTFSGMNIHKSQLVWGSLGTRVLTHPHFLDFGRTWFEVAAFEVPQLQFSAAPGPQYQLERNGGMDPQIFSQPECVLTWDDLRHPETCTEVSTSRHATNRGY